MEQKLVIARIHETVYDDNPSQECEVQRIPLSKLRLGAVINISDERKMNVLKLTDEELAFVIDDQRCYTLNRNWQVLGTVKFDCQTDFCVKDTERFAFYFETEVEKPERGAYDRLLKLIKAMRKNSEDMDFWKNIPLAQELMHILKDCCPLRDDEINPEVRMQAMEAMTLEYLLPDKEVPRLFLSFYQYWELCNELRTDEDGETQNYESYLESLDDNLFKYSWMVDPNITYELYDRLFGKDSSLRFDILQLSPEWEKEVYDIEKEANERVKDCPRGMGFCHALWTAKTEVAAEHGFHWRSPRIMNPGVRFD